MHKFNDQKLKKKIYDIKEVDMKKGLLAASLILGLGCSSAVLAENSMMQQSWEGHKTEQHCFAISFPVSNADTKGYLTVTNRFTDRIQDEIGVVSGRADDEKLKGSVSVDGQQPIGLLIFEGTGYFKSISLEKEVVSQMRAGKELNVKWTLEDGSTVNDKYSLFGFTAANNFAKKCQ